MRRTINDVVAVAGVWTFVVCMVLIIINMVSGTWVLATTTVQGVAVQETCTPSPDELFNRCALLDPSQVDDLRSAVDQHSDDSWL